MYQKREYVSNDRLFRFRASTSIHDLNESEDGIHTNDFVLMKGIEDVCHILQFKVLNKKRKKDSEYLSESVSFDHEKFNQIGALCTFYSFQFKENHLFLELRKCVPFYIPLSVFLFKLPKPTITNNDSLSYETDISSSLFRKIKQKLRQ